ncbi:uncharacterized protein V6R79_011392 [Siganus canaliculatus]
MNVLLFGTNPEHNTAEQLRMKTDLLWWHKSQTRTGAENQSGAKTTSTSTDSLLLPPAANTSSSSSSTSPTLTFDLQSQILNLLIVMRGSMADDAFVFPVCFSSCCGSSEA